MNDTLTNFTSNVTQYVAPAITYIPPSRIVPFLPDGVFFLLCGILAVIVYYYLPDEAKKGVKNFIIGYGFWIVMLIFVLWKIWKRDYSQRIFVAMAVSVLIAYNIHNFFIFDTSANYIIFFVLAGFIYFVYQKFHLANDIYCLN